MRESTVERTVCQWAKDHGISNLKLEGRNNVGKSDRLFMRHGVAAFCEFKAPGQKPTALQFKFLEERRADGFHTGWHDSVPEAIEWLKRVFNV